MFRIYRCAKCKNIGYRTVESEEETSQCSLCRAVVVHETGMAYAVTVHEAQSSVRELVMESQMSKVNPGGKGRGLDCRAHKKGHSQEIMFIKFIITIGGKEKWANH